MFSFRDGGRHAGLLSESMQYTSALSMKEMFSCSFSRSSLCTVISPYNCVEVVTMSNDLGSRLVVCLEQRPVLRCNMRR
jgi:hypothetical protein